ncbi:MAG: hypothetical protein ACKVZJ_00320 [Phycisphaerales bacterium]
MPIVRTHDADPINPRTGGQGFAARFGPADSTSPAACTKASPTAGPCRLNLLLTYGGWQPQSWVDVLPTLLEPFGVRALRARSGNEAAGVIRSNPVHIAVVDLALPLDAPAAAAPSIADDRDPGEALPPEEGGERIIELLRRLENPPPTVIVSRKRSSRENTRSLSNALRSGAFAVLEPPVNIELALEVMRRVLQRHYAGRWPAA